MPSAGSGLQIAVTGRLSPEQVAQIVEIFGAATQTDGVRPLSEHVWLHLRYGGDELARNAIANLDGKIIGYGHLDLTDIVEGPSAEVVVAPDYRNKGVGRALVSAIVQETSGRGLRLWAHGEHPAAAQMAKALGFERSRCLWQMRRSLFAALPDIRLPVGVAIRTFRPGVDDEDWVRLNARAFAGHPEQGNWTIDDLHRRMRESWFDPAGFFLAMRGDRLVGFHWTKIHGGDDGSQHGHEPIGEVYVVGVDPQEQGTGLGTALTIAGLEHLRDAKLPQAMLYVDESNSAAIKVYTNLGFTHWDTDVMYRLAPTS